MATKLLIDGYNFLWESSVYPNQALYQMEKGRQAVINWLVSKPILKNFEIYLVFDAHRTDHYSPSTNTERGIKVVFSARGQTADELIRNMADDYTVGAIVVSSDLEVFRHAEKKGCGVLGSREFERLVENPEDFQIDASRRRTKGKRKAVQKFLGYSPLEE